MQPRDTTSTRIILASRQGEKLSHRRVVTALRKVRIALVEGCNYSCPYCRDGGDGLPRSPGRQRISLDEVVAVATVFERIGCRQINLTGGEPLIRRDLPDIIDALLARTSMSVVVNTNASKELAYQASDEGRNRLRFAVSLDSVDATLSAQFGRIGAPSSVAAFLEWAKSDGLAVRINSVLCKGLNDEESAQLDLIAFGATRGVPMKFQTVFDTGDDSFIPSAELRVDSSNLVQLLLRNEYRLAGFHNLSSGVPELRLLGPSDHEVRVLDRSHEDTRYASMCSTCQRFPCDTGMYAYFVSSCCELMTCRTLRQPLFDIRAVLHDIDLAVESLRWLLQTTMFGRRA
jgi:molybdenum cofactor biosynthesis enzyme MoaA